jgi:hypothetical protein
VCYTQLPHRRRRLPTGVTRVTNKSQRDAGLLIAHLLIALTICAGLLLFLLVPQGCWPGSSPAFAQDPPLVLAFYYAWYDQNTWDSGLPADQPAQPYTSSDPATIECHVSQAQAAGIDALIQSWYGPQEANNQTETNFRTLLDVAAAKGFRAAVDLETTGPFFPNQDSVTDALRYLLSAHAQHPAYLRYQGRPVVFFWRQERFSVDEWAAIRAQVDPNHDSLWIAEGVDIAYQAVFDGHHLYSIAWSPDVGRTLTDWGFRVRRYESLNGVGRLWVATVMPGYDDTRTDRQDVFALDRRDGDYYRQTWAAAIASQPDWIIITSFNEWVEGTMIEPSLTYGDLYLNLTREQATAFKSGRGVPEAESQETGEQEPGASSQEPETRGQEVGHNTQTGPYIRADEAVRVRAGPGTNYPRLGRLWPGETAPVVGQNTDGLWWQIEFAGADNAPTDVGLSLGWVSADFVTLVGDAEAVPVISARPPTPTPTPMRSPTLMATSTPSPTTMLSPTASPIPATPTPADTQTPPRPTTPTHTPTLSAQPPTETSTPEPTGSPTPSPTATSTPIVRSLPAYQQDAPIGLLGIGIGSLLGALGLGNVLWRRIRRQVK